MFLRNLYVLIWFKNCTWQRAHGVLCLISLKKKTLYGIVVNLDLSLTYMWCLSVATLFSDFVCSIILRDNLFTWLVLRQYVRYLKNQALIHLYDLISESGHLNSNHAVTPSRFVHRRELNRRNKSESPLANK